VAAWARRRGVARALLAACEAEARRVGRHRLTLWVTIDNAPARALYEGCGFRESWRRAWLIGRLVFRAPGAILMEKPLSPL
jgi:ribosomal-protein-alanine N-acetyltransferase